jgi:RNA polymerase sigma-70 factor (ECF subfamily)
MANFFDRLLAELPRLYRTARRRTRSTADAEDLVQATVVRALERRGDVRQLDKLRPWLLRVQHTVLLNSVRGARNRFEVIEGGRGAERVPEPAGDLEDEILSRSLDDRVERALATLAPEWREALVLREVDGLSYEEIAAAQGCPIGTVRSRLARARAAVLEELVEERAERRPALASGSEGA